MLLGKEEFALDMVPSKRLVAMKAEGCTNVAKRGEFA